MMLYLTERSAYEADRRKARLVFRGYAETLEKRLGYPKELRDRLLIEAPGLDEVERVLRGANLDAIRSPRWELDGFRIIEIHPDAPENALQEWYYDRAMALRAHAVHDRRIRFPGRPPSECRYAIGETVAYRCGHALQPGRIIGLPLTPAEVKAGKSHGLYLTLGTRSADSQVFADQSDDTYIVEYPDEDDCDNYFEWQLRPITEERGA